MKDLLTKDMGLKIAIIICMVVSLVYAYAVGVFR